MRKIKLGWKRSVVKYLQLVAVFMLGLVLWGVVAQIFNVEPNKISFVPIILIGLSYAYLALYHRRKDMKLMIDILSKESGIDASKIADELIMEGKKNKGKPSEQKDKKES